MKNYRVATFNLRNFASPSQVYYESKQYADWQFRDKKQWIERVLKHSVNPDVLGFQEVFNPNGLERLCQQVMGEDVSFTTGGVVPTKDDSSSYRRPCVAFASSAPFLTGEDAPRAIEDFPTQAILPVTLFGEPITQFSRHVLRVVLELEDIGKTVFYVAHLKSKRPMVDELDEENIDFKVQARLVLEANAAGNVLSLLQRGAESTALRYLVSEDLEKGLPVVVLGDLNDGLTSVSTKNIAGQTPYAVGKKADGRDYTWWQMHNEEKGFIYDQLLYSSLDLVPHKYPTPGLYTHEFHGDHELLDHILLSNHFNSKNPRALAEVKRLFILNDHLQDSESQADLQSDHGILVVQIRGKDFYLDNA